MVEVYERSLTRVLWVLSDGVGPLEGSEIMICLLIPRPKRSEEDKHTADDESVVQGVVEREYPSRIFTESPFSRQVGEVFVLEDGESLRPCSGDGHRDFCMITRICVTRHCETTAW